MLDVESLEIEYAGTAIIRSVAFNVVSGSILAVMGRNGAGKTTLLRTLAGHHSEVNGHLYLNGVSIRGKSASALANLGISYVAQEGGFFPDLSVSEHFQIAAMHNNFSTATKRQRELEKGVPMLRERSHQKVKTLSGGERQLLKMACGIIAANKVLLLDEPSQGVQPSLLNRMKSILRDVVSEDRIAVVIAEQNLRFALDTSDLWCVLQDGVFVKHGRSDEDHVDATIMALMAV